MAGRSIVVTGPGKSRRLLEAAATSGVRAVVVESPGELARLEDVARAARVVVPVLVRLSVDERQPFGMAWPDLVGAARRAVRSRWLEPLGVHAFGVHAQLGAGEIARHVARVVGAATRLAEEAGFRLLLVDAGGGLGIPYADGEPPLDLEALGGRIEGLLCELGAQAAEAGTGGQDRSEPRIILEPGRFLAGPIGAYLATVVDVKRLHGRHVAVLDGGINHLLAPALVGRRHRLRLVVGQHGRGGSGRAGIGRAGIGRAGIGRRPIVPVTLNGPLCTDLDELARPDAFPEPVPGDLLVALDAGAYGFTESMPWFLSHRGAAEVAVEGGLAFLARRRLEPAAIIDAQVAVPGTGAASAAS